MAYLYNLALFISAQSGALQISVALFLFFILFLVISAFLIKFILRIPKLPAWVFLATTLIACIASLIGGVAYLLLPQILEPLAKLLMPFIPFFAGYSIPFLVVLFFFYVFVLFFFPNLFGFFFLFRFLKQKKLLVPHFKSLERAGFVSALLSIISPFCFIGAFLFLLIIGESCNAVLANQFQQFNAHLKDVCIERTDKSECPRTEEELRAFNLQAYKQIKLCSKTVYDFDEATQEYTWMVKNTDGVYISHSHFYPSYGFYYIFPDPNNISLGPDQVYPPTFPGPWEKLPQ